VAVAVGALLVVGLMSGMAFAAPQDVVRLMLQNTPLASTGQLVEGTTFVPVKQVGTELGFSVLSYDPAQATVTYGNHRVVFTSASGTALVNGHETRCPAPFLDNDVLMVPARFFFNNMGFQVSWSDSPEYTVSLLPLKENDLVIGTVRERIETATLSFDLQYPEISGLQSSTVQDSMNAFFSSRIADLKQQGYQNEKDLAELMKTAPAGMPQWPSQVATDFYPEYNRNGFLSVLLEDYVYAGGAHGMTQRTGYTVNLQTGKVYTLKDLFKSDVDYIALLSAEVQKQIGEQGLTLLTPFTAIKPDQGFYLKGNDLVIFFAQYEYTAYVAGFPEFHIPLASLSQDLAPEVAAIAQ
jgi:inhibitor of cysteine peptidase